jgi:hypothetical protein
MAALLTLESTGPRGEKLAMEAGLVAEIPVGWDAEFDCATFDADGLEQDELQTIVFETLAGLDAGWRSHLRVAE